MKFLSLAVLFLLVSNAQAAAPAFEFNCYTEMLTTSTELYSDGKLFQLEIIHHNGVEFTPISDDLITVHDMAYLQKKADILLQLPTRFTVQGLAENCKIRGHLMLACSSSEDVQVGKFLSDGFYFYSHRHHSDIGDQKFTSTKTSLSLRIDGETYDIPMRYYDPFCVMKSHSASAASLK